MVHIGNMTATSASIYPADLRIRVQRLLRGDRRHDDVDRLFLGLRDRSCGRESLREIGDFVAHRDERDRGPVLQQTSDVFLSFQTWFKVRTGHPFTTLDIRTAAEANLRLATAQQLSKRVGLSRPEAKAALKRGFAKLERGEQPTRKEKRAVSYLGGAFVWNPEFTDASLHDDLAHALVQNGLLMKEELSAWAGVATFVSLCVVSIMNGSTLLLGNANRVDVVAGHDNADGLVEVKAQLRFVELGKQINLPFCLYLTSLKAAEHCDDALLEGPKQWRAPLDVRDDRLYLMA